jgi:hypothetical protein
VGSNPTLIISFVFAHSSHTTEASTRHDAVRGEPDYHLGFFLRHQHFSDYSEDSVAGKAGDRQDRDRDVEDVISRASKTSQDSIVDPTPETEDGRSGSTGYMGMRLVSCPGPRQWGTIVPKLRKIRCHTASEGEQSGKSVSDWKLQT